MSKDSSQQEPNHSANSFIHPMAAVDPRAQLADGAEIGPFCVVGPDAVIGPGSKLHNNVTIMGKVTLGSDNQIFPNVVIGAEPQDLSFKGSVTQVLIGDRNIFREGVTINRGTEKEEGVTSIGDDGFFMAGCHIAHDCRIGSRVVIANGSMLGGHVHIHDQVTISGMVGIHHFTTVGSYSFIGGLSRVLHDVAPFMLVEGIPARPRCVNVVALKRNDFPADHIKALAEVHRLIYRAKVGLDHARELMRANGSLIPPVNHLLSFVQEQQEGRHGRSRDFRRAA